MDSSSRAKALHYISKLEAVDPQLCDSNPVMDALLLRTMISEAPSEDGSMNVIEDICVLVEEKNQDVRCLSALADYWENSLLRPMMQKFRRAAPHPSRDESDVLINIESPARNQSTLKVKVLRRDRYQCAVSEVYDRSVETEAPHLIKDEEPGPYFGPTNCLHIIPYSYNDFTENPSSRGIKVSAWGALLKFSGWEALITNLKGKLINEPDNCLTQEVTVHDLFGDLHGWLEEQPEQGEDVYLWKIRDKRLDKLKVVSEFDKLVNLKSKDSRYDAPSSRLLRIHAAVARFAKLSARGEKIEKVWREFKESKTLNSDGSNGDLLKHVVWMAALRQAVSFEGDESNEG